MKREREEEVGREYTRVEERDFKYAQIQPNKIKRLFTVLTDFTFNQLAITNLLVVIVDYCQNFNQNFKIALLSVS